MKKILLFLLAIISSITINSELASSYNYYNSNNNYNNNSSNYDYNYNNPNRYNNNDYYYNNWYSNSYDYNNWYDNSYDYNNNNWYNYSSDSSCPAWKIGPYNFPEMQNGNSYTTTIWNTTVSLICRNWYVSIRSSNTNSNNYIIPTYNWCLAWRIWAYSYPELSNWSTYTTTVWDTTVTLICNNWYVSVKNSSTTYYNNYTNISDNSCSASSVWPYSYPDLSDNQTYNSRKSIRWWELVTTLKCNNWYVSVIDSYTSCLSNYYSSWNTCIRSYNNRYR